MTIPFNKYCIQLNKKDSVAVAKQKLSPGLELNLNPEKINEILVVREEIPQGHKIALQPIDGGEQLYKYGFAIGKATRRIEPGNWVHSHNLALGEIQRDFQPAASSESGPSFKEGQGSTFSGYARKNGTAGTRNYFAVISSVSCAAQTALALASSFTEADLAEFPYVDGVIAITHPLGCCAPIDSQDFNMLNRVFANILEHPNVGGAIFITLGCEGNQIDEAFFGNHTARVPVFSIQELGGIEKTIQAARATILEQLPGINHPRTEIPISRLKLALQCGGSDGWSGITANPLVGRIVDTVVAAGGSAVLSETPEIVGAEQLLISRAASPEIADKLIARIKFWQSLVKEYGVSLDNNPTPGNKAGGITTIYEKSLGAIAKGGSSALMDVCEYGQRSTSQGLIFMDSPGYDPVSVTGQIASGCNLVLFTTGRGTVFGSHLAPCVKIATHDELFSRMQNDMDFNAGIMLELKDINEIRADLLTMILQTASGKKTKSEAWGHREAEFIPWAIHGPL
ncbi:MAG: altronate dehydratase [Anaerolineaceae bacterium]|nr:altronate dehydratase [Anaerolineaceae bacterium]